MIQEQWKPIARYEGLYDVSNEGRVRSLNRTIQTVDGSRVLRGRIMKTGETHDGYLLLTLCKNGTRKCPKVHRLVAITFVEGASENLTVNHIDGNKHNNHASNLEWCTSKENTQHASDHRLNVFGVRHRAAKLTENQVREIRELVKTDLTKTEIGRRYGISGCQVTRIAKGMKWKQLV